MRLGWLDGEFEIFTSRTGDTSAVWVFATPNETNWRGVSNATRLIATSPTVLLLLLVAAALQHHVQSSVVGTYELLRMRSGFLDRLCVGDSVARGL